MSLCLFTLIHKNNFHTNKHKKPTLQNKLTGSTRRPGRPAGGAHHRGRALVTHRRVPLGPIRHRDAETAGRAWGTRGRDVDVHVHAAGRRGRHATHAHTRRGPSTGSTKAANVARRRHHSGGRSRGRHRNTRGGRKECNTGGSSGGRRNIRRRRSRSTIVTGRWSWWPRRSSRRSEARKIRSRCGSRVKCCRSSIRWSRGISRRSIVTTHLRSTISASSSRSSRWVHRSRRISLVTSRCRRLTRWARTRWTKIPSVRRIKRHYQRFCTSD